MKLFGINRNDNTRRGSSSTSRLLSRYHRDSSPGNGGGIWNSTSDLTGISVLDARNSGKRHGSSNNKSLRVASRRDEIRSRSSQSAAYPFDEESRQDHISTTSTSMPHTPGVRIVTEEINGSLNVEQLGDCDVTTLSNAEFKKMILEDNLGNSKNPPTTPETNNVSSSSGESDDDDAKNTSFYSEDMIDDLIEDTRSVDIERRNRWKDGIATSWKKENEEKQKKKNKPPSSYFAFPRHSILKLRKALFDKHRKRKGVEPKEDLVSDGNNSIASAPEPRQQQQRQQREQQQASKDNHLPESHVVSFQQPNHPTKQQTQEKDDGDQLSNASFTTSKLMNEYCFDRSSTAAVTLPKHDEVEACISGMFEEMTDPDRIKEDFGIVLGLLQADSQACLGYLTDPEIATDLNGGGIVHAANSSTKKMAADSPQHGSVMENRNDVATTTTASVAKDDAPLLSSQVSSQPHHHQQQRE